MTVYLVCEGASDGLDVRVLDLVIAQKLGRNVLIEPAGGDGSLGSVAQYLRERYRVKTYVVEDRNFRPFEEAERSWSRPKPVRWIWRRHEIENYLLDPRLVSSAFRSLKTTGVRGATSLPHDEAEVFVLLQELARPLFEDHAGWLTYWRLNSLKNVEVNDVRLRRPQDATFGRRPSGRREWLDYLAAECFRLKNACVHLSRDPAFAQSAVVDEYDRAFSQLDDSEFLTSGRFIRDLEGKRLLSALCEYVSRTGVAHLSPADFTLELLNALDRLYRRDFFDPDDFAQLADGMT